jgi:hypothetical protein
MVVGSIQMGGTIAMSVHARVHITVIKQEVQVVAEVLKAEFRQSHHLLPHV